MKNYKKGILATIVVASMPLIAATSTDIIKVTTFVDEDGENTNACSLREALKAAEIRKSYGGCSISDISSSTTKQIQLEAGTYTLKSELVPNVTVTVYGASPLDWEKKSAITNRYPAQTAIKTVIDGNNNSRIFNTTIGGRGLSLNNITLKGGKTSDRGGAIYAGADISLNNVQILSSQAAVAGGAIFLASPTAGLSVANSVIKANQSPLGSVLGMSCFNDNVYSKREITFSASSIIANGSTSSGSMFDFCGEPTVNLTTNTIAQNKANSATGTIIKFSGDTKAGSATDNSSSILSGNSSLVMTSNTVVENQANTVFLYDKLGLKALGFNVLSFNNSSYACRYLLGAAEDQENVNMLLAYNAFALSASNNKCDLPKEALPEDHTNLDISTQSMGTLLSALQPETENTSFLPLYYPKNNKTETDLVDVSTVGADGCSTNDQRGIARIADGTLYYDPDARNSCDIGSVELMKFTAGDLEDLSNVSIKGLVDGYKQQIENYEYLIENPDDPLLTTSDKDNLEINKNLYDNTKNNLHYRAIYVDLKKYQLPLPEELIQSDGTHKIQFFDKTLYNVTTEALGVGQINDAVTSVQPDENLVCSWNQDLGQIIIYRKDDTITQAGDKVFCKYTIQSIANPTVKSSGLIKAAFTNIAPEVEDTSVTLKYQQNQKIALNLLKYANDDGDTGEGGNGPDNNPNKSAFWINEEGVELPIRLSNVPSKNIIVTADRQGACPAPDDKETCYGGNIYIQESNNFNPFNYSFNYQVYDNDSTPAISNVGTVNIISTATTTDDTRNASSGGGSMGWLSLLGLFGLLGYRRMKK
ncbi:CSLREA domain-containing protein [Acinetobacter venetianus]|uniref:CSLREA domain-containing protein n=1 Tax=Acinetobacter venetianus TaxID=52133 RepID=UPI0010233120|nr:CSLREA domain-containing protein [Acinetobacter venetianus]RZG86710.1 CSLREA domain-containing protein [Acinetobacter venetianus]